MTIQQVKQLQHDYSGKYDIFWHGKYLNYIGNNWHSLPLVHTCSTDIRGVGVNTLRGSVCITILRFFSFIFDSLKFVSSLFYLPPLRLLVQPVALSALEAIYWHTHTENEQPWDVDEAFPAWRLSYPQALRARGGEARPQSCSGRGAHTMCSDRGIRRERREVKEGHLTWADSVSPLAAK